MITCYLFIAKAQPIQPERMVCALKASGFTEAEATTKMQGFGGYICELTYLPNRMPIIIDISDDFFAGYDVATSEQEMAYELIQDERVCDKLRHMINIRAMENVDSAAFRATLKFIQEETNGILFRRDTAN